MNFPHKKLEWTATDEGAVVPARFADQQSLLARAITRQASSPSAKDYGAASQGLRHGKEAGRSSFLDERMAFFAGSFRSESSDYKRPTLFRSGCFRPDLAQREKSKMDG